MVLSYLPDFVAKTGTWLRPRQQGFVLRALRLILGQVDEDRLMPCPGPPVFSLPEGRSFSSPASARLGQGLHPANVIFLKLVIRITHEAFPDQAAQLLNIRAMWSGLLPPL